MFGEQPAGEFGRVILFTGKQRGGSNGGPVCRFVMDARTGVLLDLGRIDCFAVEPHHHTQTPRLNEAGDSPIEIRTNLAEADEKLDLEKWQDCARRGVLWLRNDWVRELKESGWGEWILNAAEREKEALATAVEEFLLNNPPTAFGKDSGALTGTPPGR